MKTVKVYIEKSQYGYSAYMDDTPLDYSCLGEGKTVEEITYEFYYDAASFQYGLRRFLMQTSGKRVREINPTFPQIRESSHQRKKEAD